MRKRKLNPYLKPLIGLLVFLAVSLFIVICLIQLAKKSDFLRVKDILVRVNNASVADSKIDLSYLNGRNIIGVDLVGEETHILKLYPAYKQVNLIRILPDKICAVFTPRKAVACLKLYRYFCIDDDLVIFDTLADETATDLPVIWGLETRIFGPKAGNRCNYRELSTALNIIKAVKSNQVLKDAQIKKIDVSDPDNTGFFIAESSGPLQVKIGQDYIVDKINILSSVLTQAKNDLASIKYIDLRFKQPVIKLQNQDKEEIASLCSQ